MSWNFEQTSLSAKPLYIDVTSNSSGRQLLAITPYQVLVSYNSGKDWHETLLPPNVGNISNVAIDSDSTGRYLICASAGNINVSTKRQKIKWELAKSFGTVEDNSVTSVAVGQRVDTGIYMYAVVTIRETVGYSGYVYMTNNIPQQPPGGGVPQVVWNNVLTMNSNGGFASISASKDGPYVYVVSDTGNFYISTNNGSSWTKSSSLNVPGQISISNNGQYSVFAVDNDEPDSSGRTQTLTSVSQNTAYSYTPISSLTYGQTPPISAINGSGQYMFTAASQSSTSTTSTIYYSSDGNTTGGTPTFTSTGSPDLEWTSVASNSDGNQIICSSANGGVYIGTFTPSS
jgi:hypothetical protein